MDEEMVECWMREVYPIWMEEDEALDLVVVDLVVTMVAGISVVGDVTAVTEVDFKEERV